MCGVLRLDSADSPDTYDWIKIVNSAIPLVRTHLLAERQAAVAAVRNAG